MSTVELVAVQQSDPLGAVRAIFAKGEIQHVPVLQEDQLVGLISSRDFNAWRDAPDDRPASTAMERAVVAIGPKESVVSAARTLLEGGFHSLPVVDAEGNLIGIVTSSDVIRYFVEERDEG